MYDRKRHERDWERVREFVRPEVRTLDEYEERVAEGLERARGYLSSSVAANPVPSLEVLTNAHELAFGEVYSFAGELRAPGQGSAIGEDRPHVAFAACIAPELERLNAKVTDLLAEARTHEERAQAIVFYHAQFERIEPFLDGNGRLGRTLLEAQMGEVLGREPEPVLDREAYLEALDHAHATGDLRPLVYVTTEVALPAELERVPDYQLELWPARFEKELPSGQRYPVLCPNLDAAEALEEAVVGEDLLREIDARGTNVDLPLSLVREGDRTVLYLDRERLAAEARAAAELDQENELSR